MSVFKNNISNNIYLYLYFKESNEVLIPKYSFDEMANKWNTFINYILKYNITSEKETDYFFSIEFEIDPPEPVPLVRQVALISDEDVIKNTMKTFKLNDIEENQVKFTKYKLIDTMNLSEQSEDKELISVSNAKDITENTFVEIGSYFLRYVLRTTDNLYFTGFIIIPPKWNDNLDEIKHYKMNIHF